MTKSFVKNVLTKHAQESAPEIKDPMQAILGRVQATQTYISAAGGKAERRGMKPARIKMGVFAGVPIAIAIVVLGFFLWPAAQARPATAAEIMAKIEDVASGKVTVPLRSAHMVTEFKYQTLGNRESDGEFYGLGTWDTGTSDTWFRAPGERSATQNLTTAAGEKITTSGFSLPDGRYSEYPRGFLNIKAQPQGVQQVFSPLNLGALTISLEDMGTWKDVYTVTVEGTNEILGRPVYVIRKDYKAESAAPYTWTPQHKVELWIDQEYFVILKNLVWMKDGDMYIEESATSLEFNGPVDAARFEPSKDVFVADMRPVTTDGLIEGWQKASKTTGITLYAPVAGAVDVFECGYITLYQGMPYYNSSKGVVSQGLMQHVGREGKSLYLHAVVVQGRPEAVSKAVNEANLGKPTSMAKIGPVDGRVYIGSGSDDPALLVYDMGSTRIAIYYMSNEGDSVTTSTTNLTDIANRLQSVTPRK